MNEPEIDAALRNPFRCFDGRFILEAVVVALAIVTLAFLERPLPAGSTGRVLYALLQSAAFGWIAVRSVLAVRRLDELQQRVHLAGIAVSFTVTGVVLVALGFFERAGLAWHPWGAEVWIGMVLVWWLAVVVIDRRYR